MSNEIKVTIEHNKVLSDNIQIQTFKYDNIKNKPSINGVELVGDKTTEELGIKIDTSKFPTRDELPTKTSDLENDSGFINSEYVNQLLVNLPKFSVKIVDILPNVGQEQVIYLVKKDSEVPDIYDEYIWVEENANFEFIGSTVVDLTDYVKNTDYATNNVGGVVKGSVYYCAEVNQAGNFRSVTLDLENYQSRSNTVFVSKGTLDNVLTQYSRTVPITQADYDLLETKDSNTLYLIEE